MKFCKLNNKYASLRLKDNTLKIKKHETTFFNLKTFEKSHEKKEL